jgi:hypothetical protein
MTIGKVLLEVCPVLIPIFHLRNQLLPSCVSDPNRYPRGSDNSKVRNLVRSTITIKIKVFNLALGIQQARRDIKYVFYLSH